MYRIEFEAGARKDFLKLTRQIQRDLIPLIDSLAKDPRPWGSKKLKGVAGYRVRKGDSRILYTVHDKEQVIRIYWVGHRREAYK